MKTERSWDHSIMLHERCGICVGEHLLGWTSRHGASQSMRVTYVQLATRCPSAKQDSSRDHNASCPRKY